MISALRGQMGAAIGCWRNWCEGSGRVCVISQGVDPKVWAANYIQMFLRQCEPFRTSKQNLAERLSISWEFLSPSRLTLPQLGRLFDQAGMTDRGADRLCRRLLEAELKGEPLSPEEILQWFAGEPDDERGMAAIGAIVDLLPIGSSPALLIMPITGPFETSRDSSVLEKTAQQLARWISRAPSLSVALCASEASIDAYFQIVSESYAKAVLRESLIPVSGLTTQEIRERVSHRLNRSSSDWEKQIEQLAAHDATPEMADRFVEAILEFDHVERKDQPPAARSAVERFLLTVLESTPDLAGLFELNVKPGFDFGGRPAEIDLACLSKRIAVEIDGYRHFTDPTAYRRDRRKDVLLQENGFFVLRFLAEDVVSEMEMICETIRTVVQWRR